MKILKRYTNEVIYEADLHNAEQYLVEIGVEVLDD